MCNPYPILYINSKGKRKDEVYRLKLQHLPKYNHYPERALEKEEERYPVNAAKGNTLQA